MKTIITLILLLSFLYTRPQNIKDSCINIPGISFSYAKIIPGGDLSTRFGHANSIGASALYKGKNNWYFDLSYNAIWGNKVNETNILDSLKTEAGHIINIYGEYAEVYLSMQGLYITALAGKLFTINKHNPNSGILVSLGGGILQHKIKIDNAGNNVPHIINDYAKGYDRLTNGATIMQSIRYLHFSDNKLYNMYIGIEFLQAFTQNRRSYNYDTMKKDNSKRLDLLYNIKFGWIFPITRDPQEYHFK